MIRNQIGKVPYRLRLTLTEVGEEPLTMLSLSAFLYDLLMLHDRLILLSSKYDYAYNPSWWFYGRQARLKIKPSDRLQVEIITRKSPFIVEILIPSAALCAGAALTFIKILEKRRDWDDDEAIKKLTRENLELDKVIKMRRIELSELQREKLESSRLPTELPHEEDEIEISVVKDRKRLIDNEQLQITDVEILEYIDRSDEDY